MSKIIRIFTIVITNQLTPCSRAQLLRILGTGERERIHLSRYSFTDNSIIGYALIHYVLCKYYGINSHEIKLSFNKFGKPQLMNNMHVQLSISHTESMVSCAIGDVNSIGIDIEEKGYYNSQLVSRLFAEDEIKYVKSLSPEPEWDRFYRIWTMKESYLKLIGTGITIPLNSFSVLKLRDQGYVRFIYLNLADNVIGHMCCYDKCSVEYVFVDLDLLIQWSYNYI